MYDIDMCKKTEMILLSALLLSTGCAGSGSVSAEDSASVPAEEPVYSSLAIIESEDDIIIPFNTTVRLETLTEEAMDLLDPVFQKEMTYYAKLFDRRHDYEGIVNLSSVNASYGSEEPVVIDPALFSLLQEGTELTRLTDGLFNITIGAVYDLWRDKFSPFPIEGEDPPKEEIDQTLKCVVPADQIDQVIELNEEDSSVTFHRFEGCEAAVVIDAGAIGKGYAVDLTGEKLSEYGLPYLVNSGSSSIQSYTDGTAQKDWYLGVRNPYARVYTLFDYVLNGSGVFTVSGDDSSYFILNTDDGPVIRHHILNPRTGYPENYVRTMILTAPDKGWLTDALTTALFSAENSEQRLALIRKAEEAYQTDLQYAWFEETAEEQGILTVSPEFRNHIIESSICENIIEIREGE